MDAAEWWPQPMLVVVRLRPGQSRAVELAINWHIPIGGGRQSMSVLRLPKPEGYTLPASRGEWAAREGDIYDIGGGLSLVWEKDLPGITLRAAEDAKPGALDVAIEYTVFAPGSGLNLLGFRVIIEAG
jgi:hypothetical protein